MKELAKVAGTRLLPLPTPRNDVMWVNNWIPGLDCTNVEDLTTLEVEMRKIMRKGHEFMKKNIPSFREQLYPGYGLSDRDPRRPRLMGEYIITEE